MVLIPSTEPETEPVLKLHVLETVHKSVYAVLVWSALVNIFRLFSLINRQNENNTMCNKIITFFLKWMETGVNGRTWLPVQSRVVMAHKFDKDFVIILSQNTVVLIVKDRQKWLFRVVTLNAQVSCEFQFYSMYKLVVVFTRVSSHVYFRLILIKTRNI